MTPSAPDPALVVGAALAGIAHATAAAAQGSPQRALAGRAHAQSAVMFGVWDILTTRLRVGHYV